MQATKMERQVGLWGETAVRVIVVLAAAFIIGLVLGRMGVLNGLVDEKSPGETAVGANNTAVADTVAITAADMRFGHDPIRVKVGQTVMLQLANDDFYAHSFDVDELGIHQEMAMRSETAVSFTPDKPGTYQVYCGVPGHTEAGMTTTLIVEP